MATERKGRTLTIAVGAGLLAWLLLHGTGWGLGRGDGASDESGQRVRLRVSDGGVTVDGEAVTIAEAVERARAAGHADVVATGAARTGTVADLMKALDAAGVVVYAASDVWDTVGESHA